jgi:hypothetical protein
MPIDDNASPASYDAIEADITAMEDFAKQLSAEIQNGYSPMLNDVSRRMRTAVPPGDPRFPELRLFLEAHQEAQNRTYANVTSFRLGSDQAVSAAQSISDMYRGSDAFASAKVEDVNNAFAAPDTSGEGWTSTEGASVGDVDAEVF